MRQVVRILQDIGLLIARIGLGAILIAHGWRRWQQQGIQQQIDYVTRFGVPYPGVVAWGAVLLELIGGVFLIVGALTPLVALAVLVEQVLIICYTNWRNQPYLLSSRGTYVGGYEYNVALGLLALLFFVFGAGRASIDRLFRRNPGDEEEPVDDRSYA